MAGTGRKVWAADEVLSAADLQSYIQDQVVFVYANASARTSGILSPSEGMVSYLADTNLLYVFDGASWVEVAPNVGTPGTYTKVTTDAKGRVSSGTTLSAGDIPALDSSKITTGSLSVGVNTTANISTTGTINTSGLLEGSTVNAVGGLSAGASGISTTGNIVGASTYNQTNTGRAMFVNSAGLYGIGSSSKRFKENIVDASIDIESVKKIVVRNFTYKKSFDSDSSVQVGVIAEELEALGLQEFLFYGEDGRVDGVAYEKLALALIPVIQDLDVRLSKLEK